MQGRLLMLLVFSICFTRGSFRSCPTIPVQKNFTLSEFMGTWFEIESLNTHLEKGDCITHTFSQSADNWIYVNTTEKRDNGKRILYMGKLSPANVNQAAKLQILLTEGVYMDFGPVQDQFTFIPYNVLATDFQNYSLIYSCTQHYFTPTIYAWIMSRGYQLEESTIKDLENILKTNGINIDKMQQINQKDCP
ncbi:apolipoprotein D-like isoform X1 [Scyliorhinus canicula]|nr:apolipoprotein D-like isoform X1 [Scyliorhinus canicula]XP_038670996.1 apolipoprotein D-like isoform X1 [Scyliorhinus canicula]